VIESIHCNEEPVDTPVRTLPQITATISKLDDYSDLSGAELESGFPEISEVTEKSLDETTHGCEHAYRTTIFGHDIKRPAVCLALGAIS